jgi:hypothetical protein
MVSLIRKLKRMPGRERGRVENVEDEPATQRPMFNTTTAYEDEDDADADSGILPQCECYNSVEEVIDLIYNAPHFSVGTKESGLEYLTRVLDLLETLSHCDKCSDANDYRVFMHSLCNNVLEQCWLFYRYLSDMYDMGDQLPLRDSDLDKLEEQKEQVRLLCLHAYLQMKRLYSTACRLIETLKQKPVFDEDAWWLVRTRTYRLAICTASLGSQTAIL